MRKITALMLSFLMTVSLAACSGAVSKEEISSTADPAAEETLV